MGNKQKSKKLKKFAKGTKAFIREVRLNGGTITIALDGLWGVQFIDADPEDIVTLIALAPVSGDTTPAGNDDTIDRGFGRGEGAIRN